MSDFETAPLGTIAELERVRQDRDELARNARYHQQEIDALLIRLRKTQSARDAHMAHSARVNEVLFKTFSAIEDGDDSSLPYDEYRDAYNDSPVTSLARRDRVKKAEEADYIADNIAPVFRCELRDRAKYLRQQANQLETT